LEKELPNFGKEFSKNLKKLPNFLYMVQEGIQKTYKDVLNYYFLSHFLNSQIWFNRLIVTMDGYITKLKK